MKIILSRKGFDSSSGGCPSPIFPDGSLFALPIPDARSQVGYGDIHFKACGTKINIGDLVEDLTQSKKGPRVLKSHGAHLDPDMIKAVYPRKRGWRPLLGQHGSAQGHLHKQGVQQGDIFLYFGLFREVEKVHGRWKFVKEAPAKHVLWGWMQIGEIHKVDDLKPNQLKWARYHPHFTWQDDPNNVLYLSSDELSLNQKETCHSGAGVFPKFNQALSLTRDDAPSPTHWSLPKWFYPLDKKATKPIKTPLSYHNKLDRWQLKKNECWLQCVARGQEFVLDTQEYPEAEDWLTDLVCLSPN